LQRQGGDLDHGELRFYRPEVDQGQLLKISEKTISAARVYLEMGVPTEGTNWRASASARDGKAAVSAGRLTGPGMSERSLIRRVATARDKDWYEGIVGP